MSDPGPGGGRGETRRLDGTVLAANEMTPDEGFVDPDGHYRNKCGAIPGYCPCGNGLSAEELDWNDGLCDECASGEDDMDDGDDDVKPSDDAPLMAFRNGEWVEGGEVEES